MYVCIYLYPRLISICFNKIYMNTHTYIYMYIHSYLCTYMYMYIYIWKYTYICIFTYIYVHIYLHMYIEYTSIYTYVCLCTYIYSYVCIYIYTYRFRIRVCRIIQSNRRAICCDQNLARSVFGTNSQNSDRHPIYALKDLLR